jgi:hypothetical protein
MGIIHIVMFEFKEEVMAQQIADVRLPGPMPFEFVWH